MKIYIGHSREYNYLEDLYTPIKTSLLFNNHEIILPHDKKPGKRNFISKDIIKKCNLFIAEVSFPSTGLGIELGWANIFNTPILCIYRKGTTISGSLKYLCDNFIEYSDSVDMIEKISNHISFLDE